MRTPIVLLALLAVATSGGCGSADGDSGASTTTSASAASPGDALWGRTFVSTSVTGPAIPGGGPLEVAFRSGTRSR